MKSIKVFAPATVANVACGFDILGFAVENPGDELVMTIKKEKGVVITKITGDGGRLPADPALNTAGVSAQKFLEYINADCGVEIELHKKMPLGSGMGSSAASAVAAVFAANKLFGEPRQKRDLLPFTLEGEKIACGVAHADNTAPSLFGGFVLVRSYEPLDIVELPVPENLYCAIVHPNIEIQTKDARKILKKDIPMKDAITQWGNIAGLVAGILKKDYALIGRSLQDAVVEPVRSILIPHFDEVKACALTSGALGCSISGSGPSIFALAESKKTAADSASAMKSKFESYKIQSEIYVSKINVKGPKVLAFN